MRYQNAEDVLPPRLLDEIREHISGAVLYIPRGDGRRLGWGELTRTREILNHRNLEMRALYSGGASIDSLMERYHLSYDSVKKIVRGARRGTVVSVEVG